MAGLSSVLRESLDDARAVGRSVARGDAVPRRARESPEQATPAPSSTGRVIVRGDGRVEDTSVGAQARSFEEFTEGAEQGNARTLYEENKELVDEALGYLSRVWAYAQTEGDEDAQSMVRDYIYTLGLPDVVGEETLARYGLDTVEAPEDNRPWWEKATGAGLDFAFGDNLVGRTVGRLMDIADEPSQAVLGAFGTARQTVTGQLQEAAGGLSAAGRGGGGGGGGSPLRSGLARGIVGDRPPLDVDADGIINFREALGVDPEAGGRLVGALDTAGVILTDPLTYIGFGAMSEGSKAALGLRAVRNAPDLGDDVARQIAQRGWRSLAPELQERVQRVIYEAASNAHTEAVRPGVVNRVLGRTPDEITQRAGEAAVRQTRTPVGRISIAGRPVRTASLLPGYDQLARRGALPGFRGGQITRQSDLVLDGRTGPSENMTSVAAVGDDEAAQAVFGAGARVASHDPDKMVSRVVVDDDAGVATWRVAVDPESERVRVILDDVKIADQGKGVGTRWWEAQQEQLARNGIDQVELVAEGDGARFWAGKGFELDTNANPEQLRMWGLGVKAQLEGAGELNEAQTRLLAAVNRALKKDDWAKVARFTDETGATRKQFVDDLIAGGTDEEAAKAAGRLFVQRRGMMLLRDLVPGLDEIPGYPAVKRLDVRRDVWRREGGRRAFSEVLDQSTGASRVLLTPARAAQGAGRLAARAFDWARPRAVIERVYGKRVASAMDEARVAADAAVENRMNDMRTRVMKVYDDASRAVNGGYEELDRIIIEALETQPAAVGLPPKRPGVARETAYRVAQQYDEPVAQAIRVFADIREEISGAAVRGGLDPENLNRAYFPRYLTPEGEQMVRGSSVFSDIPEEPGMRRSVNVGEQARQQRRWRTDLPLPKANEALRQELNRDLRRAGVPEHLLVPEGTQLFDNDLLAVFSARGQSAFKAAADVDMLERLGRETIETKAGRQAMVIHQDDLTRGVPPPGYNEIETPNGLYYAPEEIADEIQKVRDWVTNDAQLNQLKRTMGAWTQLWGVFATSPLWRPGFHARNAQGNILLNALGGVVDPMNYARANRVQRSLTKVYRQMRRTGQSFDEAAQAAGYKGRRLALMREVRDQNIVNTGFFDDLTRGASANEVARPARKVGGRGRRGAPRRIETDNSVEWLAEALQKVPGVKQGRALGNAIEDNARIAHYIAKREAGYSVEDAAASVRQYLFDYSDLTGVERSIRRNLSRFYTFMRKNFGVQLWTLAHYPGRTNAALRATLGREGVGEDRQRREYAAERGDTIDLGAVLGPLGDRVNEATGWDLDFEGLAGGIDTPMAAAGDVIRPFINLGAMATGSDDVDAQDFFTSVLDLTSGGPRAFADLVYESITGIDTFTGFEKAGDATGAEARAREFLDALIGPAWSSFETIAERATRGEGVGFLGNNPTAQDSSITFGPELLILSNILGLNAAPTDTLDEAQLEEVYALRTQLRDLTEELGLPTLEEYEAAGVIPERPSRPSRAGSVVLREQIAELQEQGLPTAEVEQRLSEVLAEEAESGVRIDPETGEYTTREARLRAFAGEQGIYVYNDDGTVKTDRDGNPVPSTSSVAAALYNVTNPDDPVLKDDGTPYTYLDVPVRWDLPTGPEVLQWLRDNGVALEGGPERTTPRKAEYELYNENHPQRPYIRGTLERLEAGFRPYQGVAQPVEDGYVLGQWYPEGMGPDNFWYNPPPNAQSPAGGGDQRGSSVLAPPSGGRGTYGSGR